MAMQFSYEISNSAMRFGVELFCRWQQILSEHGRDFYDKYVPELSGFYTFSAGI